MASPARNPSARPCTLTVRLALPIVMQLRAAGAERVLDELGLDPRIFDDSEGRITHDAWVSLLERGAEATGDPAFGLHAAERCEPDLQDLLMLLASSQATIRDAFYRGMRYGRVAHEGLDIALTVEGGVASCRFACLAGLARPPILSEYMLATWMVLGGQILGEEVQEREIRFRHPRPADISEHTRIFGPNLRFRCAADEIVFPTATLDETLLTANPYLSRILEDEVRRIAERIPEDASVVPEARAWLGRELAGGGASIEGLAEHLRMSPRTLRRRLRDEGTTHTQLVDELRRERARAYVAEGRFSIDEISFLLGFSESSAFRRAFKRWTGRTPSEYRRGGGEPNA